MCGEKPLLMVIGVPKWGSPPRVRGKARVVAVTVTDFGITPACAGKSFEEHGFVIGVWDHPRVCGEKTKKIP